MWKWACINPLDWSDNYVRMKISKCRMVGVKTIGYTDLIGCIDQHNRTMYMFQMWVALSSSPPSHTFWHLYTDCWEWHGLQRATSMITNHMVLGYFHSYITITSIKRVHYISAYTFWHLYTDCWEWHGLQRATSMITHSPSRWHCSLAFAQLFAKVKFMSRNTLRSW